MVYVPPSQNMEGNHRVHLTTESGVVGPKHEGILRRVDSATFRSSEHVIAEVHVKKEGDHYTFQRVSHGPRGNVIIGETIPQDEALEILGVANVGQLNLLALDMQQGGVWSSAYVNARSGVQPPAPAPAPTAAPEEHAPAEAPAEPQAQAPEPSAGEHDLPPILDAQKAAVAGLDAAHITKEQVIALQNALNAAGADPQLEPDGCIGPHTLRALQIKVGGAEGADISGKTLTDITPQTIAAAPAPEAPPAPQPAPAAGQPAPPPEAPQAAAPPAPPAPQPAPVQPSAAPAQPPAAPAGAAPYHTPAPLKAALERLAAGGRDPADIRAVEQATIDGIRNSTEIRESDKSRALGVMSADGVLNGHENMVYGRGIAAAAEKYNVNVGPVDGNNMQSVATAMLRIETAREAQSAAATPQPAPPPPAAPVAPPARSPETNLALSLSTATASSIARWNQTHSDPRNQITIEADGIHIPAEAATKMGVDSQGRPIIIPAADVAAHPEVVDGRFTQLNSAPAIQPEGRTRSVGQQEVANNPIFHGYVYPTFSGEADRSNPELVGRATQIIQGVGQDAMGSHLAYNGAHQNNSKIVFGVSTTDTHAAGIVLSASSEDVRTRIGGFDNNHDGVVDRNETRAHQTDVERIKGEETARGRQGDQNLGEVLGYLSAPTFPGGAGGSQRTR